VRKGSAEKVTRNRPESSCERFLQGIHAVGRPGAAIGHAGNECPVLRGEFDGVSFFECHDLPFCEGRLEAETMPLLSERVEVASNYRSQSGNNSIEAILVKNVTHLRGAR
jgi:hypothetical protein